MEAKLLYEIVYDTCVGMVDPDAYDSDFLKAYPGICTQLNSKLASQMETFANLTDRPGSTPLNESTLFVDLRREFEDLSIAQKCSLSRILVTKESLVPSDNGS